MNVERVTHNELEKMFDGYYDTKEPVFLHGNTGTGKSQSVEAFAKRMAEEQSREYVDWSKLSKPKKKEIIADPSDYFCFVDVRMAEVEPSDLRGLPDFVTDGEEDATYVDWMPPLWVAAITTEDAAGIIFLDEANLAPQMIQSVLYKLTLDRKISQRPLAEDAYVLGAGNITGEDQGHFHDMAGPLRNRFLHLRLKKPEGGPEGSWTQWATDNGIDPRIVGFIGSDVGREYLYTFTEENNDAMAFATPRSWEKVSNLISSVDDSELLQKYVGSCVGPAVAAKFNTFLDHRNAFDVQKYLNEPSEAAEIDDASFDQSHAALSALAGAYDRGEASIQDMVDISAEIKTEFAAYLLMLCKQYADDEDEFSEDVKEALNNGHNPPDFSDILRVVAS